MNKKLTLIMMLIVMSFAAVMTTVQAVIPQDFFTDGFKCERNDDGARTYTIVAYESTIYTNIIPEEIDGFTITRIGERAFKDMPQLTGRIDIPDSVISIGKEAFSGCSNITSVEFGSSLTEVGDGAFSNCASLKSVVFNNVQKLGDEVFYKSTSLDTKMDIPVSVKSLGDKVFYMSSVKTVNFKSLQAPMITPNTFDMQEGTLTVIYPKGGVGYTPENYWPATTEEAVLKGDINLDNLVDSADAAIALNLYKYNNATAQDIKIGDMDENGMIDSADAAIILNVYKYGL